MMAIGPITGFTCRSTALIVRELASITQVHASANTTTCTIFRGWGVNLGKVILHVRA